MASRNKRHIHKYYRANLGFADVWACALPDCTHYMPPNFEPLVNGKKTICWSCSEETSLNPININMKQPICDKCRLGLDDETEAPMSEALAEMLKKVN